MEILMINFVDSNDPKESKNNYSSCDWHGCDCEYNCYSDDDCTSDSF